MGVNNHPDMFQYFWTVIWEYIYTSVSGIGEIYSNLLKTDLYHFVYIIYWNFLFLFLYVLQISTCSYYSSEPHEKNLLQLKSYCSILNLQYLLNMVILFYSLTCV